MKPSNTQTLPFLVSILKHVQKEYPGNINLGTIIKSMESRMEFHKNKQ